MGETHVNGKLKPTHDQPGGFVDTSADPEDGVVNDSLGTVDIADSTGVEDEKETGDAKDKNLDTHED